MTIAAFVLTAFVALALGWIIGNYLCDFVDYLQDKYFKKK